MEHRVIDRLIAEKIMGWEYEENSNGAGWKNDRGFYYHRVNCWNPSTRLEQAWKIVEKLEHDQKHLVWHEDKKQWCFIFGKGTWGRWSAYGDTASIAICLAALNTLETTDY